MIDRNQLAAFTEKPDRWLLPLNEAMSAHGIDTPVRTAHFLAQVAHESSAFKQLSENLNYSYGGLMRVWSAYFTVSEAVEFAHDKQRIANRVYANRMGNGDEESGDGWRFHGRGLIQLTGRDNYREASRALGLDLVDNPDLLLRPDVAAKSAAWFWESRGCNELADGNQLALITRRINGGMHGLQERKQWLAKASDVVLT